ncbi:hypothetical protein Tco_0404445 [Tanacetum coccineum]
MPSCTSSESRVISGRVEYFCKCNRQLTVQTTKARKNLSKRFVTCAKCNVYDFLDDDLPSEYYKELLYEMFQKQKQSKKHMDYEQVINVLARGGNLGRVRVGSLKGCLVMRFIKVFYYAILSNDGSLFLSANASCKCKLQIQAANQSYKCKLQMLAANAKLDILNITQGFKA